MKKNKSLYLYQLLLAGTILIGHTNCRRTPSLPQGDGEATSQDDDSPSAKSTNPVTDAMIQRARANGLDFLADRLQELQAGDKTKINHTDPTNTDPIANGFTVLHLAAVNEEPEIVEALLKLGANPVAQDSSGLIPLMSLFRYGSINNKLEEVVNVFLNDPKVDTFINFTGGSHTALFRIIIRESLEVDPGKKAILAKIGAAMMKKRAI